MINFKILKELSQHLSVLYVEDDDTLRIKTARIFTNLFKYVDVAVNGKDALHLYKENLLNTNNNYDIVISDIQMPYLSGIQLSKEIFKINKNQKIIIISAYNDKEYLIELINIGVDGFIQKPLSSDQMLEVLYEACTSFQNSNHVRLSSEYYFDKVLKILYKEKQKVDLSSHELKLLDLFTSNINRNFTSQDIFNHIYYEQVEKEFSADSVKSLIKRLRKKIPKDIISNSLHLGYSLRLLT